MLHIMYMYITTLEACHGTPVLSQEVVTCFVYHRQQESEVMEVAAIHSSFHRILVQAQLTRVTAP